MHHIDYAKLNLPRILAETPFHNLTDVLIIYNYRELKEAPKDQDNNWRTRYSQYIYNAFESIKNKNKSEEKAVIKELKEHLDKKIKLENLKTMLS